MNTKIVLQKAAKGYNVVITKQLENAKLISEIIIDKPSKAFDEFVEKYNISLSLKDQIVNGNAAEIEELLSEYF